MFKSGLTQQLCQNLISHYSLKKAGQLSNSLPFVYVGGNQIKFVTDVIQGEVSKNDVFAVGMAEDGFIELLAFEEDE